MECIISNPMLVTQLEIKEMQLTFCYHHWMKCPSMIFHSLIWLWFTFSQALLWIFTVISRVHRKLCVCQAREIQQDSECNCIRFGWNLWCLYSSIILPLHSVPVADIKMLRKTQKEEFKQWLQWPDRWAIFYAGLLITQ